MLENQDPKMKDVTHSFISYPTNPWNDAMQVCVNGHLANSSHILHPENNTKFCKICGSKTITSCPKCIGPIKGDQHKPYYIKISDVPNFCEECGIQFPWGMPFTIRTGTPSSLNAVDYLQNLFLKFRDIANALENGPRTNKKVKIGKSIKIVDEYDVQLIIYPFLILNFQDVRPEEYTPSYAGSSTKIDFLLKIEELAIESKITRKNHGEKEIRNELLVDIATYKNHGDCKGLVCFIYDRDQLFKNKTGFIRDLEHGSTAKFQVRVFIA